ncbi:hypothetical protein MVEN_01500800 [Mycena venus]|uniref:RNA polymerase II-associated protein 3 n=1 Tax=Mycena venus TaxID=2733690 RepID=A0A8H6XSU3_9AGAR|nr:hypothetical protein MVEN_01500800 [Mycena venus]
MARAAQEKEKGNAAFKAGDYPTAIGHYSAAIHSDRTDATFPLNRAAAYLKLGKYVPRDSTPFISSQHPWVCFRRAQARVAMGKLSEAQEGVSVPVAEPNIAPIILLDLKEAAKLEPANQSVKQELTKVAELIQQASAKKSKTVPADVSSSKPTPKRRRIPITIVEADGRRSTPTPTNAEEAPDLIKPVSSRPLNAPSSTTAAPPPKPAAQPTPKPSSFKDAKSARDSSKPSRVGGGIFRASGDNTIFTPREGKQPAPAKQDAAAPKPEPAPASTKQDAPSSTPPAPAPVPKLPLPIPVQNSAASAAAKVKSPMTLFDFTRAWESASDPAARLALSLCASCFSFLLTTHLDSFLLLRYAHIYSKSPPAALPSLFQISLEPALFVEIVDTLGAKRGHDRRVSVHARVRRCTALRHRRALPESCGEDARARGVGALGVGVGSGDGRLPPQLEEVWAPVYR